jgi:hypothetical protein
LPPGCKVGLIARRKPTNPGETAMNTALKTLMFAGFAFVAISGCANNSMMKKDDGMAKDGMMKKEMTMQECKDHMAMANKDGMMKKDDAMMKMDTMCADMMKK